MCHSSIAAIANNTQQFTAQGQCAQCGSNYYCLDVTNGSTWTTSPIKGFATAIPRGTANFTARVTDTDYNCGPWNGTCSILGKGAASGRSRSLDRRRRL